MFVAARSALCTLNDSRDTLSLCLTFSSVPPSICLPTPHLNGARQHIAALERASRARRTAASEGQAGIGAEQADWGCRSLRLAACSLSKAVAYSLGYGRKGAGWLIYAFGGTAPPCCPPRRLVASLRATVGPAIAGRTATCRPLDGRTRRQATLGPHCRFCAATQRYADAPPAPAPGGA